MEIPSHWFKPRGYLHFDPRLNYKKALALVSNPESVAQHSFYPFLHQEMTAKKIKKNEIGDFDVYIKSRHILYSSHADSHIYAYYTALLSSHYEQKLKEYGISDCVLAFRPLGKTNIDFANDAFLEIKHKKRCSAVALDASKFFDTLDHEHLKKAWANIIGETRLPADHFAVFKSITKFATCYKKEVYSEFDISPKNPWYKRTRICSIKEFREIVRKREFIYVNLSNYGIPQGAPISALLSNIYMLEFDKVMNTLAKECGGSYRRYCDDMLFIVNRRCEERVQSEAYLELQKLKVSLNQDKTEVRKFWRYGGAQKSNKPLQYLGFTFDGQRILLRSSGLAKFSRKMTKALYLTRNAMDSSTSLDTPIRLKKKRLYEQYSHLGYQNYIRYGLKAAKKMQSKAIKRQLKPLWKRLNNKLDKI